MGMAAKVYHGEAYAMVLNEVKKTTCQKSVHITICSFKAVKWEEMHSTEMEKAWSKCQGYEKH